MKTKAAASGIRRGRDRVLVDEVIKAVAENGGKFTPEVCALALDRAWETHFTIKPKRAWDILQNKMKRDPNIRRAIADVYEEAAEFSLTDGIRRHVEHIQDGSYPALKDYLAMTLPAPSKKVEVEMGFRGFGGGALGGAPPVAARALGPAVVEEAEEAIDVKFDEAEEDVDG